MRNDAHRASADGNGGGRHGEHREPHPDTRQEPARDPEKDPDAAPHGHVDAAADPATLLKRFDRAAAAYPQAVAVRTATATVTYGTLAAASRELAGRLVAHTARPGPVAVVRPAGPGLVCAALAALRCGKPYLPVDPAYPPARVERILADAAPAAVVDGPDPQPGAVGALGAGPLAAAGRLRPGRWGEDTAVTAADAYVIYTSGSTGTPKGVVITHAAAANLLDEYRERRPLPPHSRSSTCASPGFDASILENWHPLTTGGELVVTPDDRRWHPEGFVRWLAEQHIADAYVPAPFLPALARAARDDAPGLRSLLRLVAAVEPIPRGLLGDIKRALPHLTVLNAYGPTEAAVCCLIHEVTGSEHGAARTPIGTPIRNTHVFLAPPDNAPTQVDGTLGAEPAGPARPGETVGELYVGGAGVGRYLRPEPGGRPAFQVRTGPDGRPRRYYRTGDVVRVDAFGQHTFLGRADDMVKVRGYRVEPGDVEHALLEEPGVAQAVAVVHRPPGGTGATAEQLVAHVVPEPGAAPDPAELQRRLRDTLPWYAVPHRVTVRDALPLTPHGKVDRRALAAEETAPQTAPEPAPEAPPGTDPELLRLWTGALGPADPRASFLANGGDSLTAGRLAAAVERELGRRVPVLGILRADGLADLAAAVRQAPRTTEPPAPAPRTGRPADAGDAPATAGQRGLWFHDALHPGSPVYNEALVLRLRGPLDTAALTTALTTVTARHEALRTSLVMSGDDLRQVVRPPTPLEPAVTDLRATPPGQLADATGQAVRAAVREPLDLARGPHLRAHLLRTGAEEHVLVLSMHHSTMDGWSADVLFEELSTLYTAAVRGEEAALEPPGEQYRDHALRQRDLLTGGHLDEDLNWWRGQLAGLPTRLDLPTDRPRPHRPGGAGALARARLSPALVARVDRLARETGATRYAALLAAVHVLLSRYCGTGDVVTGVPFSGRTGPHDATSIGYYVNLLPLRGDLGGAPAFRDLLARTQENIAAAYTHQRVPYPLLAAAVGAAAPGENPYLQVCVVPEDVYRHEMEFAGVTATLEYHDTGIAKFDLTLNLIPDPAGGLRLTAEYRTGLFDAATIERLLGHLETLLDSATAAPGTPVTALRMLTAPELARVLGGFDGPRAEVPGGGVHDLVDRWAARTPDALAVAGRERLTYAELTARANRLAHYLADRGAEPGSRVGVRLPRSTDAVVAFLAVLKTGCAYVPLDPATPARRLAFMAGDAETVLDIDAALLDADRAAIAACPADPPAVATTGDDAAYVIYTSGSTGRPKGVEIRHRCVADLAVTAATLGIGPGARLLHMASVSFDMATFDIWGTLGNGARLVIAPAQGLPPDRLAALIRQEGVTHGDMPTALFHRQAEQDPASLGGLRTLLVGGETLGPDHARAVLAANPGLRLVNGYGPTEATAYSTFHVLTHPDQVTAPVPIGRPTPNTRARVLDRHGQPVPVGVPGELHLGGPGLAAGYVNEPGLTAERFIPDRTDPDPTAPDFAAPDPAVPDPAHTGPTAPGPAAPARRLYRTGDLARWRPDGTLDHLGRTDQQIKLHGHRIEPGDIEAALRTHPAVTGAVVTRREDEPGHPYLAAYCTTAPGRHVTPRELTDVCAATLPPYLVPRVLTLLERFPITVNGKIDRAALPPPAEVTAHAAEAAPGADTGAGADGVQDGVQEEIAAIWRSVIAADVIGPDERLFDIGGGSLHVAGIHRRVADRYAAPGLRMIDLFTHPTIRSYAAHVQRLLGADEPDGPGRDGERHAPGHDGGPPRRPAGGGA
jgi:amino acid adenylation domain-containing protein